MIYEETVVLNGPFDEALARTKAALAAEGFGTLTEIDLQTTLLDKIGKEIEPYVIVGACNPQLAGRALDAVPQIGALLPCNVIVRQVGDDIMVEALDPGLMATITGNDDIGDVADEARERIGRALSALLPTS